MRVSVNKLEGPDLIHPRTIYEISLQEAQGTTLSYAAGGYD